MQSIQKSLLYHVVTHNFWWILIRHIKFIFCIKNYASLMSKQFKHIMLVCHVSNRSGHLLQWIKILLNPKKSKLINNGFSVVCFRVVELGFRLWMYTWVAPQNCVQASNLLSCALKELFECNDSNIRLISRLK